MSGTVGDNFFRASGVVASAASDYDDDVLQSDIALLGFYVAVNGSLVRYNLVDQSIDEYFDTSGVDASASTNERRSLVSPYYYEGGVDVTPTITEDADDSGVDGDYTWYKWTDTGATGSYSTNTTQDHDFLVIAGGGAGGAGGNTAGGGGAGGYRNSWASEASGGGASSEDALSFVGSTTYTITVGTGGVAVAVSDPGNNGVASSIIGGLVSKTTVGGGGGGSPEPDEDGLIGGSGGGGGGVGGHLPGAGTADQGFSGGTTFDGQWSGAGGGGAGEAGINVPSSGNSYATDGGDGLTSNIDGSGTFRAGGGGGTSDAGSSTSGGTGGGGAGTHGGVGGTGIVNTGSGGGAGGGSTSGAGGTGIVILRRLTAAQGPGGDLTLQSTDVTAQSEPDYAELVMLIENAYGTATLNTDIKGYVSEDSGVTFTQGTLVDEGSWGTNRQILAFHDLDISAQSGTSMCYKITTHNQSAGSKETRIYATSIGWR